MSTPAGSFPTLADLPSDTSTPVDTSSAFEPASLAPQITFATHNITPPSTLYISRDDRLRIIVISNVSVNNLTGAARVLKVDGTIQVYQLPINASLISLRGTATPTDFDLSEGFLLDVTVFGTGGVQRGSVFIVMGIIRGPSASPLWVQTLVSDYAGANLGIGWPGGRLLSNEEGPGQPFLQTITNPPIGSANLFMQVGQGLVWQPIVALIQLTTSAAVANRQVSVIGNVLSSTPFLLNFSGVQAASLTRRYMVGPGLSLAFDGVNTFTMPLPDGYKLRNGATDSLQFNIANVDAGDQMFGGTLYTQQWVTG